MEKYLGMPIFDYFGRNPELASLFSETMVGFHGAEAVAVATAYDFSKLKTIVDVGGATEICSPRSLVMRPERAEFFMISRTSCDAPAMIQSRGLTDRITIEGAVSSSVFQATAMFICSRMSSTMERSAMSHGPGPLPSR